MRRLTIHLTNVEPTIVVKEQPGKPNKVKKKIFNTVSFIVKDDVEIEHHLSMHGSRSKHYISNLN